MRGINRKQAWIGVLLVGLMIVGVAQSPASSKSTAGISSLPICTGLPTSKPCKIPPNCCHTPPPSHHHSLPPGHVYLLCWTPVGGSNPNEIAIAAKVIDQRQVNFTFHGKFHKGLNQGLFATNYFISSSKMRAIRWGKQALGTVKLTGTLRNHRHFSHTGTPSICQIY